MIRKNWPSRTAARRIGFPFFCTGSLLTSRDIDTFRPVDLIRNLIRSVPPVQKHKRKEKIRPLLPILLTRAGNEEVKKSYIYTIYANPLCLFNTMHKGWVGSTHVVVWIYLRTSLAVSFHFENVCLSCACAPGGLGKRERESACR